MTIGRQLDGIFERIWLADGLKLGKAMSDILVCLSQLVGFEEKMPGDCKLSGSYIQVKVDELQSLMGQKVWTIHPLSLLLYPNDA